MSPPATPLRRATDRSGAPPDARRDAELRELADHLPQLAWIADADGSIQWYNRRWYEFTGTTFEQVAGSGWRRVHHPEHLERAAERFAQAIAAGEPWEDTFPLRRHDGAWRWFLSRAVPIHDEAGRVARWFGTNTDVTDVREAAAERERLLAAEQAELIEQAQLLQLSFDAIFVWRLDDGAIERWNRGAQRLYGYEAHEAIGHSPHALLATAFPQPLAEVEAALRAQGTWTGEIVHRTRAGDPVTVAARLQRFAGSDGRDRVLEINRDLTESIQARLALQARTQELAQSRMRLDVALAAGGLGVWDWDLATGQAHWSGRMYALLGLPERADGAGRGEAFVALVHPEDRSRVEAGLARAMVDCGGFDMEFRLVRPDGTVRWLISRGQVACDAAGKPARMLGVNFDITERRAIEQQLREVDARRNEFLAMLAHELRNPLAPMANAVRLLERIEQPTEQQALVTQILRRQTAQMARLVDDLLEVSRVTQGRIELRKENLLAASAILPAVESVRPLVREQDQTLVVDVPTDIDLVADPARLTQIVANLLNNAAKYTPAGGRIAVSARAPEAGWVEIEVADDGMGIDAELLPRVFDLFSQGAATLDRARGGLGIGLSLVKRLVELHGGTVRAESAGRGRGSTFTVRLPRTDRRAAPRTTAVGIAASPIAPTSILVADDNRDAAESMALLLRADGHRVRLAFDGEQALAAARQAIPRVALLDLGMPRMDGFELARALRAEPALEGLVMVAVSGYGQAADRARSAAAGFDAHLLKPAALGEVYAAVEQALERRGRQAG